MIAQTTKIIAVLLFAGTLVSAGGCFWNRKNKSQHIEQNNNHWDKRTSEKKWFFQRVWDNIQKYSTRKSDSDWPEDGFLLTYEGSEIILEGAKKSEVNGQYRRKSRLLNEKYQYFNRRGEYTYTIYWTSSRNGMWYVTRNSQGKPDMFYYKSKKKNGKFPPTGGWENALDVNHHVEVAGTGHLYTEAAMDMTPANEKQHLEVNKEVIPAATEIFLTCESENYSDVTTATTIASETEYNEEQSETEDNKDQNETNDNRFMIGY